MSVPPASGQRFAADGFSKNFRGECFHRTVVGMVVQQHRAEEAMAIFNQAAEANNQTQTHRGNMILLDEYAAKDVFLTGDLHGNAENFHAIVERADLEHNPGRHLVFQEICHGGEPYPHGGGCRSHQVLEAVAEMKVRYPQRVHHIMSNHELAELTGYPIQKSRQLLNMSFAWGLRYCYGRRAEEVRLAMLGYLESCPLAVRIGDNLFFSHSIPEGLDQKNLPFDDTIFYRSLDPCSDFLRDGAVYRLVWGRDYRQENADRFASRLGVDILVCGHEPCLEGFKFPNSRQAILDCCGPTACCMLVPTYPKLELWNYRTFVFPLHRKRN
ncbi:MAG: metallophosphoesterase [Planctomycetia bacterium]|nr:metallophosphoesterase [Planctomycetia bacterium]